MRDTVLLALCLCLCVLPASAVEPEDSIDPWQIGGAIHDQLSPVVVLFAEPGTLRTEALMRLLLTRFDTVSLRDTGAPLTDGHQTVYVVDHLPGGRSSAAQLWLPYLGPRSSTYLSPTVFIGETCRIAADAFGLLRGEFKTKLPLSTQATWTGNPPSLAPVWRGEEIPDRGWRMQPVSTRLLGSAVPPLTAELEEVPPAGISVTGQDSEGRTVALLWHQGRFVNFVPGGPIESLGPVWQSLLLESVSLANVLEKNGGFGRTLLSPGDRARPSPRTRADLHALGIEASSPEFLPVLVEELHAAELDSRLRARRLLEEHMRVGTGYGWGWIPKPGASAAQWSDFLERHQSGLSYSSRARTWHLQRLRGEPRNPSADSSAIDRATRGYKPFFTDSEPVTTPAAFSAALHISLSPPERSRLLGRLQLTPGGKLSARDLLASARAQIERGKEERRSLTLYFALAMRRLGPAAFDALWELANEPRPFSYQLHHLADQRTDARVFRLSLLGGELIEAFRGMAWHGDADHRFFSGCASRLEPLVDEILDGSATVDILGTPRLEDCRAMAFELLAALSVGRTRGLLDSETWTVMERLARRVAHSDSEFLTTEYLVADFLYILQGERDALGLELASSRIDKWRHKSASQANRHYRGCKLSQFGQEGIVEALKSIRNQPPWDFELPGLLAEDPRCISALLDRVDSPLLALRAITILQDGQRLADLLQDGALPASLLPEQIRWIRRRIVFSLGSPYLDRRPAWETLLALIEDSDPWIQAFACRALREPRGDRDTRDLAVLSQLQSGSNSTLAALAGDALRHRIAPLGWRISAVLSHSEAFLLTSAEKIETSHAWNQLENPDQTLRAKAAYFLAITQGEHLLIGVVGGEGLACERALRIENEIEADIYRLCELMDDEFTSEMPATSRLSEICSVALPEFEFELMRPYRFPIGRRATYEELKSCLIATGAEAWPIYLSSLYHWRGHGFGDIAPDLVSLSGKEELVAPFLAMGFAQDVLVPKDSEFTVALDGTPSDRYVKLWRNLGSPGKSALRELSSYPDDAVRTAASVLLRQL